MISSFFLPVIVAVVLNQLLGAAWYSKMAFGPAWLKEVRLDRKSVMKANMASAMTVSVLCSFVLAASLYYLLHTPVNLQYFSYGESVGDEFSPIGAVSLIASGVGTVSIALFMFWLAFVAAIRATHYAFEQRSLSLFAISSLHDLATIIVMGLTIALWR